MRYYREGTRLVEGISGPLIFVGNARNAGLGEVVTIETTRGNRTGQVLQVDGDVCAIQVLEGTLGLNPSDTTVWFERDVVKVRLSEALKGQILDGSGVPRSGVPIPYFDKEEPITGSPLNPAMRSSPNAFIETGISSIDVLNTLVRGQKLPIFSGSGLPANEIAAQIVRQARVPGNDRSFLVVFAAIGITEREARFFRDSFEKTGALFNGVFLVNLASDSAIQRLLTPRTALTIAEYFAFEKEYDVLVVMTDMLHYSEALREVSSAREEAPGRRGFPGYLYSDLAGLYERAGCIKGKNGSITQIPIVTMPGDDMTHPVVDLSGYITEGQIVLDRGLQARGVYPPVNVLSSLSRLMNKGIGEGKTLIGHRQVADQLFAAYARSRETARLRLIVGDEGLTNTETRYLSFGNVFEKTFLDQGNQARKFGESLDSALKCLAELPDDELYRIPDDMLEEVRGYRKE
ncbi:MAG TPA: V-type ATP synthase subunit B [Thermovirgaceae bacterium]|nr:V-type ATP synthase subunit B [Thermovirgaceae bacterium]